MPAILLSPTFWKFAGIALLVMVVTVSAGVFVHHYQYLKEQAALVAPLQSANKSLVAQSARDDSRAADAAIKLVAAQAARDQAIADQGKFHELAGQIGTTLQGISHNANATKNPVCLPSDGERILFNTAITRFLSPNAGSRQSGTSGEVPGSAP